MRACPRLSCPVRRGASGGRAQRAEGKRAGKHGWQRACGPARLRAAESLIDPAAGCGHALACRFACRRAGANRTHGLLAPTKKDVVCNSRGATLRWARDSPCAEQAGPGPRWLPSLAPAHVRPAANDPSVPLSPPPELCAGANFERGTGGGLEGRARKKAGGGGEETEGPRSEPPVPQGGTHSI